VKQAKNEILSLNEQCMYGGFHDRGSIRKHL
jgi:hypothetical protein